MQTFLPYPSFAESSAVLDSPRLGKQRVETLQVLRAILLPSYGWQSHPVSRMWRGHLPALTAYGLANVAAWVERGHADSTHDLIAEFAPGMDGLDVEELGERGLLPPWIGDEEIHRSHRSNLIRKDPEIYGPLFPGTPPDLDYAWPEAGEREPLPEGIPLRVIRPRTDEQAEEWRDEGIVAIADRSPQGRDTPKWRAQLSEFVDALEPGTEVATLVGNGAVLHRATVTGDTQIRQVESGAVYLVRTAEYTGTLARADFVVPAILQDPRAVFPALLSPAR
ncbi:MSMEG_6728 family protein [Naasia sp. SYSU D00057]|uniref:MSMEG_6728 family protein n=1 Tax=Naasia sp. SYSU D00057 TaxID=2817380 RepID=UPI001B30C6ED|nr:MSMEG_6728 family protein [Naasia sp. SYSU D00057]